MSINLIDTYISEIGRHLPKKTRADIEAEIRSILQDMLDERCQKTGKPVDEEMTLDVLKTYGAPEIVASTYVGERYLIGPRLYPVFITVLRIALMVIGILAAMGLGVAVYQTTLSPLNTFDTIIKAITNFGVSVITVLGNIVLIFAILEWALYRAGTKVDLKGLPKEKGWDPRSLAKVSSPNQIKIGETILEIVGCFAAIVIFNFYPQIFGLGNLAGEVWYVGFGSGTIFPLLSQAFFYYISYLTLVWALTIILDIVLLRIGRWAIITRIFSIGLKVVNILIAVAMLAGPSLIAVTAPTVTTVFGDAQGASLLINLLTDGLRILLWISIISGSIDIIRTIYRTVTGSKRILPA